MRLFKRLKREIAFLKPTIRTLRRVGSISRDSPNLACDDVEAAVDRWPERTALTCEGRDLTYSAMDALANRYAHWARAQGMRRGDVVAVVLPNRIDYAPLWLGLTKVGVVSALVNNHLTGQPLAHCLAVAGAEHIVVDETTAKAATAALARMAKAPVVWTLGVPNGQERDLATALKSASGVRPDRTVRGGMTAKDVALYVFTCGTTGLPKAARITHMRVQLYMRGFAGSTGAKSERPYLLRPAALSRHRRALRLGRGPAERRDLRHCNGSSRRRASGTMWSPQGCTMFVYIGELCRYLVNQPEQRGRARAQAPAGLRQRPAARRLALSSRTASPSRDILEFYGATEGNVSMFNFDGTAGRHRPGAATICASGSTSA